MLNKGATLVVTALFCLVALTGWYAASLTHLPELPAVGSFNMGMLTGVHVIQTNPAGSVQYQGSIAEATQLGNENVNFTGLNVTLYDSDQNALPITLTADEGTATNQNSQIDLMGHVTLTRPQSPNSVPLLVKTDAATIYPDTETVKGSGLITFSQPGTMNQTSGVGFVANLQQKWMKLLSQVKSTYATQH